MAYYNKDGGQCMADKVFCNYSDNVMFCNHILRSLDKRSFYGAHSHNNVYELIYIKSGDLVYGVEGKEYQVRSGDLLITCPNEEHYLYSSSNVAYERYNLLFDENMLGFTFYEKLPNEFPPLNIEHNRALKKLFDKFDFYAGILSGNELQVIFHSIVREICIIILLELAQISPKITENKTVLDALDYIDANLLNINTVEDISSALFISKSNLQHMFSKHLGKSPKKYVVEKKLLLARREINQGAKPSEIYTRYGFSEYSAFFRAYKKAFGQAPSTSTSTPHMAITPENTMVRHLLTDSTEKI